MQLSSESTMILLQKINAQIIEFNAQGTLAAIGCKYGIILIFDMLSKVVVRSFTLYHQEEPVDNYKDSKIYQYNIDLDYFTNYRTNLVYVEDDFVFY